MEPVGHANIPVNVHAALLSDASLSNSMQGFCLNGPMQTMVLEDRFSNMTLDEAIATLRQLSNENHQLKSELVTNLTVYITVNNLIIDIL